MYSLDREEWTKMIVYNSRGEFIVIEHNKLHNKIVKFIDSLFLKKTDIHTDRRINEVQENKKLSFFGAIVCRQTREYSLFSTPFSLFFFHFFLLPIETTHIGDESFWYLYKLHRAT